MRIPRTRGLLSFFCSSFLLLPRFFFPTCCFIFCVAVLRLNLLVYVCTYFDTLFSYGNNNKTHVCQPMITLNVFKLNFEYICDKQLNEMNYDGLNEEYFRIHLYEYL